MWGIAEEQTQRGLDRALAGRDVIASHEVTQVQEQWNLTSAVKCRDGMSAEGPLPGWLYTVDVALIDSVTISTQY